MVSQGSNSRRSPRASPPRGPCRRHLDEGSEDAGRKRSPRFASSSALTAAEMLGTQQPRVDEGLTPSMSDPEQIFLFCTWSFSRRYSLADFWRKNAKSNWRWKENGHGKAALYTLRSMRAHFIPRDAREGFVGWRTHSGSVRTNLGPDTDSLSRQN